MTSDNEMRWEWGDKSVQTRRWKICTYEMATYVAFWRAIRVPAVNNRYCRTHTPFRCLSGRVCADDRKQFVQPTSPAPMVFYWALISKEVRTHTVIIKFLAYHAATSIRTCSASIPPRPNWPCDVLPQQYISMVLPVSTSRSLIALCDFL